MSDPPAPRMFVGVLAYNWETRDKKLYPYNESCPSYEELKSQGYRLYRFSADIPWHDLCPPAGHEMVVAPFEEEETKDPLPEGQPLAAYVYEQLRKVVTRLLPGGVYGTGGLGIHTPIGAQSICITTRYGKISITVKDCT